MPITNIIHSFYSLANIFATVYYSDMKDTEIKKIIEDMKAAGCGSADTDSHEDARGRYG